MQQVLAPGVVNRNEPDLGTQMLRSAAMVRKVSAVAWNRMSWTTALFWCAMVAIFCGTVRRRGSTRDRQQLGLPIFEPLRANKQLAL
jgi:hypothetical protein